ncbi:unnamed protein product [Kuraishia capsulata CBS 1993]|uniref:Major facilitator superfamily (MFS) profile domain-containing protein n=1 Tax=Kuraishia capsulata CBS 1993 TaxID=1382522 RepID=W6MM02_9ASCO|nr:uncharacterized protein KUCA_T00003532001 [Kuraishia capsulata CBS 1993]CDK27554.1 unnamed protein product [Kuraishia capsulata CBS 1993]
MSDIEKKMTDEKVEPVASITEADIGTNNLITTITSVHGREVQVTGDVDEAMRLALKSKGMVIDAATNKRILRKIDMYMLPLCCFLYACQFMDKTSNSLASIMGLRTDLNMVGDQYSWTGTAFYLGYLFFEFIASFILQRFPLAKTTSIFIVFWGIILCLHATPNYAGFVFLRTVLGMAESSVTPAMVMITSQWWKKDENFLRTAFWFASNGFGTIMGSSIAYGLAKHADSYSIAPWKILFVVVGLMTICVGIIFWFHIPNTPAEAWFLTEEEKLLVVERIRSNQQGFGNKHFKKSQFIEALRDYRTWLFFVFALAQDIPNGSLTNFGSILMNEDFGYTTLESLKMGMIPGAIELVGCIACAACVGFVKHRLGVSLFVCAFNVACSCMLAFAKDNKQARLTGYFLLTLQPVGFFCILSSFAANTAGHTKKVTVNAIYLIGYCVGNLIGPQTFIASQAPSYSGGKIAMVVGYAVSFVLLIAIYASYYYDNKARDQAELERGGPAQLIENAEFADLTDFENPNFRYSL